ncbi:hypothetical protein BDP67DRAFT_30151 [Colletotrichum lupini]|nr:hypothetical protein BDP67DRAFT_30151 [Colletotrichum lupini]
MQTVLSTDIVKFQDLSNENENATRGTSEGPIPIYSFSVAAFGTWAVASVLMTIATLVIVKPAGNRRRQGNGSVDYGTHEPPMEKTRRSRLITRLSHAWNIRDRFDSAVDSSSRNARPRPPSPATSALAISIHTAPTVVKMTSKSRGTPAVDMDAPVCAESSQTWPSMGYWLGDAWNTLWRSAKDKVNMTEMATTPLPQWDSRRDEGREDGQKSRGEGS